MTPNHNGWGTCSPLQTSNTIESIDPPMTDTISNAARGKKRFRFLRRHTAILKKAKKFIILPNSRLFLNHQLYLRNIINNQLHHRQLLHLYNNKIIRSQ